jgi:FkbM family methyltransferase
MHCVRQRKISKLALMNKSRKIVDNWIEIIFIYFNQKKEKFSTLKIKNGIKIKLRNNSTDIQAFANVWLLEEYNQDKFIPKENDIVIDIGAHIGLYAMYISQKKDNVKIFSYEPVHENYNLLNKNIKENKLHNVKIFNFAVGKTSGKEKIFLSNDQSAHNMYEKSENFEAVNMITLDEIIKENKLEKISILKLDCEGAEYDIFENLSEGSFEKIEKICFEYHIMNEDDSRLNNLKEKLIKKNFKLEILPTNNNLGMIFAKK